MMKPQTVYLDHASYCPIQPFVKDSIETLLIAWSNHQFDYRHELDRLTLENKILCANLLQADHKQISIQQSTASCLSVIAQSLSFSPGDKILLFDNEYPSTCFPFMNLEKKGIEIVWVNYNSFINSGQSLAILPCENIKAFAFSHVSYMTGIKLNLAEIANWCKQHQILSIVDATQSMVVHDINIKKTPVDVLVASAYKWLMTPNGIAFAYINRAVLNQLSPITAGWVSTTTPYELPLTMKFKTDAAMLEPGGKGLLELIGAKAALHYILDKTPQVIQQNLNHLMEYLFNQLNQLNVAFSYDYSRNKSGNIIVIDGSKNQYLSLTNAGITCTFRQGKLRFSPYIFNTEYEIDYMCYVLKKS